MRRTLDGWMRRLGRPAAKRLAQAARRERDAAHHRAGLRARVAVAAILRREFPEGGPAVAHALRLGEEAMAELAAIPDTAALGAADDALIAAEPGTEAAVAEFAERLARLAEHQAAAGFDPDQASPAELLVQAALRRGR